MRERNLETLEQMQINFVSVEANLLAKKARLRNEMRVTIKEETSTSKFENKSIRKKIRENDGYVR